LVVPGGASDGSAGADHRSRMKSEIASFYTRHLFAHLSSTLSRELLESSLKAQGIVTQQGAAVRSRKGLVEASWARRLWAVSARDAGALLEPNGGYSSISFDICCIGRDRTRWNIFALFWLLAAPRIKAHSDFTGVSGSRILGTWPGPVTRGYVTQQEGQDVGPGPLGCLRQGLG
jgi:hypothetical protein